MSVVPDLCGIRAWKSLGIGPRILNLIRTGMLNNALHLSFSYRLEHSRAPRGAAAGVAFHAGAVAHQGEIPAFAAGFAVVAFGLGFGALFRRRGAGFLLRPGERIERACGPQALL